MKKFLSLLLALTMLLTLCGAASAEAGVFTGVGDSDIGGKGAIEVAVTVDENGAVTAIEVTKNGDTAGISDPAVAQIPGLIVEQQTANVDAVAGATKTSDAIMAAVLDAVTKAGLDTVKWSTKVETVAEKAEDVTIETEIVEPQPDATKSRTIRTRKPAADATRTVQVPQSELRAAAQKAAPAPQPVQPVQTTQQFIPDSAQAPQIVPQTQPKPAVPAPEAAPKRRGPVGMPRTYAEAEAALNERIRADHIWLSNPVLVRGLGMAPVIGAALDGQRALILCIAALILVTFTRVLAVAVCHLTKNRFRPVVYCYSAALLYIPTYILLYRLFGTDLSLLGIYLPIMVVEPAIVKRMEFADLEPVKDAFRHGFNNALGMCIVLLIVGCLRELLATGAVFGNVILHNALLPLAALPAGGFVIVGILAAVWCAAANLYTDYKHEEVRRLYADRKH